MHRVAWVNAMHESPDIAERRTTLRWILAIASIAVPVVFIAVQAISDEWSWKPTAGSLAGGLALAVAALALPDLTVQFDMASRTMRWANSNCFRSKTVTVPFSEIVQVVVVASRDRTDDDRVGGYRTTYRPVVLMASGRLPLSLTDDPGPKASQALCDRVAALIGHRGTDASGGDALTTAAALAVAGRVIDAVQLVRDTRGVDLNEATGHIKDRTRGDGRSN